MSQTTIEWTQRPGTVGETWNPTTGCNKVDRGCKNCYAEVMHRRLQHMMPDKYKEPFLNGAVPHPEVLPIPLAWRKPRTVFVDSMSDLFHENIRFEFIEGVMRVIDQTPQHTYLVLTKRPERAVQFWGYMNRFNIGQSLWRPPVNLWMGTSVNDQPSALKRIPQLLRLGGVLRFLSYEPATGALDLTNKGLQNAYSVPTGYDAHGYGIEWTDPGDAFVGLDWVICGGESGAKAVPMHPDWARRVRDDCARANVPFFFKQWGQWEPITYYQEHKPVIKFAPGKGEYLFPAPALQNMIRRRKKSGCELDGQVYHQFPEPKHPGT
jgi:protein gp37